LRQRLSNHADAGNRCIRDGLTLGRAWWRPVRSASRGRPATPIRGPMRTPSVKPMPGAG